MSDVMSSRIPGQFAADVGAYTLFGATGGGSKSVSAYQRLVELQRMRMPFSIKTRLGYYENMLIESIDTPDDVNTLTGLRCTVNMTEVLVASVSTEKVSARAWNTSKGTNRGSVEPQKPPESIIGGYDPNGSTGGSQGRKW